MAYIYFNEQRMIQVLPAKIKSLYLFLRICSYDSAKTLLVLIISIIYNGADISKPKNIGRKDHKF